MIYTRDFFAQDATIVARELLGATLVHMVDGQRVSGRIVETEAYTSMDDLASHGRAGKTPRNMPMWEAPGHAYVYLVYGMYWLLNATCEPEGQAAAALIRAVEPLEGLGIIAANREGRRPREWTNGPGRLTVAMGISGDHNRFDMTGQTDGLWIEQGIAIPDEDVQTSPRVGLGKNVGEPWLSIPWRWYIRDNPHVSAPR